MTPGTASLKTQLQVLGLSLLLLAVLTGALEILQQFFNVETVTIIYLIAVMFAAIRGGVAPAIVTAVIAIAAAAFFFYAPIYDLRVYSPIHLVDLVLFVVVAVVTGKLATDLRKARLREQADALREALIGSVSHELRTPLSSILGSASVLARSPAVAGDGRLGPLVTGLRDEAERLNDHIQDLLDASRISSEGVRPRTEWVDPGDIVNAAVQRKRGILQERKVEIVVADNLPLVETDPALIEKALGHLIENAVKYSAAESPIRIAAEPVGAGVRLIVQDQGLGFAPEDRDRLWERFYRSPHHRDRIVGSGLGLWIARSLATACGVEVGASSEGIGRGAILSLYIPGGGGTRPRRIEALDE